MERTDSMDLGPKDIFLDSLRRCDQGDFLERFYERFMASSPEVREKFKHTDFDRQRGMLRRSLQLIAEATAGDPVGLREMRDRADTHSRAKLDIEPRLYSLWLEGLIVTAGESDPEWTPAIESAWRVVLGFAIQFITLKHQG